MKGNKMKITVIHKAFEDEAKKVALVNVPTEITDMDQALEYAYRWTNNVMGSWSRDDIENNGDFNPDVERLAPLHEGGYGLRSTSMGDEMLVNGKTFEVAICGFEEVV